MARTPATHRVAANHLARDFSPVGYDGNLLGLYLGEGTLVADAYSNILRWDDLSGNGRHLVPCDGQAPPSATIGGTDQNVQAWSNDFTHYGNASTPVAGGWTCSPVNSVVPTSKTTLRFDASGGLFTTMTHRLGGAVWASARVSFQARKLDAGSQNLNFRTGSGVKINGTAASTVALSPALTTSFQSYSYTITMTTAGIGVGSIFGWSQIALGAGQEYEIVDFKVEDLSENHRCANVIPCPTCAIAVPHYSYRYPYLEFGRGLSGTDNSRNTGLQSPAFSLTFPFTLYMAVCYPFEGLNLSYFDSLSTYRGAAIVCRDNTDGRIGFRNAAGSDTVFSYPPFLRWHVATWTLASPGGTHQINRGPTVTSTFNWGAITDLGGFVIGNTGGGVTGSAGSWKCGGVILRSGNDDDATRFKHQLFLARKMGIQL